MLGPYLTSGALILVLGQSALSVDRCYVTFFTTLVVNR